MLPIAFGECFHNPLDDLELTGSWPDSSILTYDEKRRILRPRLDWPGLLLLLLSGQGSCKIGAMEGPARCVGCCLRRSHQSASTNRSERNGPQIDDIDRHDPDHQ